MTDGRAVPPRRPPTLGLFFFESGEGAGDASRYDALLRSARFADENGFSSLWVPERHFMDLGALYPAPAVLLAAVARETTRIGLRAGSVVLPLHHPVRVAEEWSVLDNLSGGRVGIACASGWHPDDFVLCPEKYEGRRRSLPDDVALLRSMWRGESVRLTGGTGEPVDVRIRPTPVQRELPLWITSAGTVDTFVWAGRIGANLLTYLALHDPAELREKIALYRESLAAHGHDPSRHTVTVWVHVYLDEDDDVGRARGLSALADYYTSDARRLFAGLSTHHARSGVDVSALPPEDFREYVQFVCARMADRGMAMFGSPERCADAIARLAEVGVDEVACQLDFAVSPAQLPRALERLARVRRLLVEREDGPSVPSPEAEAVPPGLDSVRRRCREEMDAGAFYAMAGGYGLEYGPSFRHVRHVWRTDGEALGRIRLSAGEDGEPEKATPVLDAALLDACLQVLLAAASAGRDAPRGAPYFSGVREFRLHGPVDGAAWSHARLHPPREGEPRDTLHGDVVVHDEAGRLLVEVLGLRGGRMTGVEADLPHRDRAEPGPGEPDGRAAEGWMEATDLGSLLYEMAWRRMEVPAESDAGRNAPWLVLAAVEDEALAADLSEGSGGPRRHLRLEPEPLDPGAPSAATEFRLPGGFADALAEENPARIVYLHPAGAGLAAPLRLVQALAERGGTSRLFLVTRGAVAVSAGEAPSPEDAALWGFGRSVHHEQPQLTCTLVDTDAGADASLLRAVVGGDGTERQLALRSARVFAARLARVDAGNGHAPVRLSGGASYLVTGGTGALGLLVAEWMARRGAGHLLLLGRRAPGAEARRRIDRLVADGTPVTVLSADVADADALEAALRGAAATHLPIRGIVHAAGVLDDGVLEQQTPERLRAVLAPKLAGARALDRLTAADPPDFFVSFSSIAAVLGSPAQTGYAAANAALDALAHAARARGRRVASINWGMWGGDGGSGMSASLTEHRRAGLAAMGMGILDPGVAVRALEWALARDVTQLCVFPYDWARLGADGTPFLAEVLPAAAPPAAGGEFRRRLDAAPPADRPALAEHYLRERLAEALRQEVARVDAGTPLTAFGVDSLVAIELRNRVAAEVGVQVPLVRLMQDVTVAELALWVCGELETQPPPAPADADAPLDAREAAELLAGIGDLEEGEVDALLERLLAVG